MDINEFPPGVMEHLGWYVYRLIDPGTEVPSTWGREKAIVYLLICAVRLQQWMMMSYLVTSSSNFER